MRQIVEPILRMKLNDACLQALGYKPEQCRFAMTYTEVREGVLRPVYTQFNFDSPQCSKRVEKHLGINYLNGFAHVALGSMRLAVKGANKQHAVAVCAAASLLDEKPSELLGATLTWKVGSVW